MAVAVLLGVALIAFVVQNTQKVQIKFFGASGHIPLVVALLAAAKVVGGFSYYSTPAVLSTARKANEER